MFPNEFERKQKVLFKHVFPSPLSNRVFKNQKTFITNIWSAVNIKIHPTYRRNYSNMQRFKHQLSILNKNN